MAFLLGMKQLQSVQEVIDKFPPTIYHRGTWGEHEAGEVEFLLFTVCV